MPRFMPALAALIIFSGCGGGGGPGNPDPDPETGAENAPATATELRSAVRSTAADLASNVQISFGSVIASTNRNVTGVDTEFRNGRADDDNQPRGIDSHSPGFREQLSGFRKNPRHSSAVRAGHRILDMSSAAHLPPPHSGTLGVDWENSGSERLPGRRILASRAVRKSHHHRGRCIR